MVTLGRVQPTCYRSAWISSEGARVNSLFRERSGLPNITCKLMTTVVLPGQMTQSSPALECPFSSFYLGKPTPGQHGKPGTLLSAPVPISSSSLRRPAG